MSDEPDLEPEDVDELLRDLYTAMANALNGYKRPKYYGPREKKT